MCINKNPFAAGSIDFVSLTNETLQGALNVLYEAFFPHENVCCATGLSENRSAMKELEELTVNTARDGVSIIAVEKSSGDVLGAAFNKLQVGFCVNNNNTSTIII